MLNIKHPDYKRVDILLNEIDYRLSTVRYMSDQLQNNDFDSILQCFINVRKAWDNAFELFQVEGNPYIDDVLAGHAAFLYYALHGVIHFDYRHIGLNKFMRYIHYILFVYELNHFMINGVHNKKECDRVIFLMRQCYNNQYGKFIKKEVYISETVRAVTVDNMYFRYIYNHYKS